MIWVSSMIQVYLYRCEKCETVVALYGDRGDRFYMDKCETCNDWADFEKIVISSKYKLNDDVFAIKERTDAEEGQID